MRFRLLGPMAVDHIAPGGAVPGGARLRALLAALLLRANAPVSREVLAEAIWDGKPPAGAAVTLRTYVLRLRQALGPEAGARIEVHDPGYLIRLARSEVDVLEFEELCREAARALRAADWARASATGARAVALWRGAPLLDVPSQLLRDEFVPRLEQLLVQVREDSVEADLQSGRHAHLVAQLRELTAAYPLRERFHTQLLLALARGGRRAEALEAYQHARRVLVDQLGIEPGLELRELHERVLAGELEPAPAAAAPRSPAETASAAPRQLPAASQHFIGRRAELDELVRLLDETDASGGTVVISAIDGMAGIGKTALAVHAAHRLAEKFPDGQLFIDLHGYTRGQRPRSAGEALTWLLRALGAPAGSIPADSEQAAALYRQRLAETRTLIVLDNAAGEAQIRPLLPGGGSCLVLVTSRRRLRSLDDAHNLSLDLLRPPDAVALLHAIAGPDRIPADDPVLGEVAALCGHLPLALRIAGALLRHRPAWQLEYLASVLRDRHQRVSALSDGERDLSAVFDLSYATLDEPHRRLWRVLGLVPGADFDVYAAAALSEVDPATAAGLLEDLVDHNLLIAYAPGRYRLHDLLRAHAHNLAAADPDRAAALDRLFHYYAHTALRASIPIARFPRPLPSGPAPAHVPALTSAEAARAWLRAERDNLDAAHTRARALDLHEHALALAAGMAEILRTDGPFGHALDLYRAAAETAERYGLHTAQADALTDSGTVLSLVGDFPGSGVALARAVEIYRATGNRRGEGNVLTQLGIVQLLTGDANGATESITRALSIQRATGNRHGEAVALADLGRARIATGDLPGAADVLSQALNLHRETDYRSGEAYTLIALATVQQQTDDLAGAAETLSQALEIFRATGHLQGEAGALTEMGIVRRRAGDLAGSADALFQALEHYRTTGNRSNESWTLNHYAATVAATGDLPGAVALYRQGLAMNRELNKPDDEAIALEGLGECHLSDGDTEAATNYLRQALEIYERLGMAPDTSRVQNRLNDLTS